MKRLLWLLLCVNLQAAEEFNYDEAKVPPYELPKLLVDSAGNSVASAQAWQATRREEIRQLLEREMFGKAPARPKLRVVVAEEATLALDGKAMRKQVRVALSEREDGPFLDVLVYTPVGVKKAPVIFGLNFLGNHTVQNDPQIRSSKSWVKMGAFPQATRSEEIPRGQDASKWQVAAAIARGYGVVTAYYGDIDPDFDDQWKNGVHALHQNVEASRDGQTWGSLAAWAWGMSLVMDYLETEPLVDADAVAVQGFSRLGKAALWAAACDQRFALVISQQSGAGGAALNKRIYGETVGRLNQSFPHWFCGNFKRYSENEKAMAFDSHFLLALVAPRPLLVTSAVGDQWADPRGEFLAAGLVGPVYELFGKKGLMAKEMPLPLQLVDSRVGYFLHPGKHDVTAEDWKAYADFCDKHLRK